MNVKILLWRYMVSTKKILIIIAVALVVIFGIAYMTIRFSSSINIQSETEKYKIIALEYTIEQLKTNGTYDPNKTYRVNSIHYRDPDKSGDKVPYATIQFKIGKSSGYIVTMEKNALGEFEITTFESFD